MLKFHSPMFQVSSSVSLIYRATIVHRYMLVSFLIVNYKLVPSIRFATCFLCDSKSQKIVASKLVTKQQVLDYVLCTYAVRYYKLITRIS